MLSKCASPGCSTPFRSDLRYARKSRELEYVWLCSSCRSDLTIQVDDDHGVRVVRKRETLNGSIQNGPSMQLKQRGAYTRQENSNRYGSIGVIGAGLVEAFVKEVITSSLRLVISVNR